MPSLDGDANTMEAVSRKETELCTVSAVHVTWHLHRQEREFFFERMTSLLRFLTSKSHHTKRKTSALKIPSCKAAAFFAFYYHNFHLEISETNKTAHYRSGRLQTNKRIISTFVSIAQETNKTQAALSSISHATQESCLYPTWTMHN